MAASNLKYSTGLVLGKFYPPTAGHQYLISFAEQCVEELTVLACSLKRETIPGELRWRWLQEMFPRVRVVNFVEELPQYPEEDPEFWSLWLAAIRRYLPNGPDVVFASEDYGFPLAEILGARFIPVDNTREIFRVSATAVRNQPLTNWEFIPEAVRPYFVRKVCIIGPESTGKSTLAHDLAAHFHTLAVPEYARGCIDAHDSEVTAELFELFLRGQRASELALERKANRLLICDTDAFTTALYYEMYLGACPPHFWEEARRRDYHLYLITRPDTPYVRDGSRHHEHLREDFFERSVAWVKERSAPYAVIGGDWASRWEQAVAAVAELLAR